MTSPDTPMSALPEDDEKLIAELRSLLKIVNEPSLSVPGEPAYAMDEWRKKYLLKRLSNFNSYLPDLLTRIETLSREIGRYDALVRAIVAEQREIRAETLEEAGLSQRVQESILRAMNAADISQRALAKQIGVTEARVCQMLSDGSNLTLRTVERIFEGIRSLTTGSAAGQDTDG